MHLSVRPRRREDFAMNSFLLIAVYGATLAIALAFTFTEYGNEKNTTGYKKSHDDFEPEFEDALRYCS